MKRNIYEYKNELFENSIRLRELSKDVDSYKKARKLLKKQDEIYKKWLFIKNLSIAMGKKEEK